VWVFYTGSRHASWWWDKYSWGGRTRVWFLDTSGRHASGWCDMYSWGGKNQNMSFRHWWWTCLLMMDFVNRERCREACEKVVDDGYFKQLLMSKHIRLCWDDGGGGATPDCQDQILGFSFSDLSLAEEQILFFPILF
jgi:hypothetical protein